jgi:dephospho-CoA kinase
MLTIGLTGGIGSGKTAVSDAFAQRGVPIIDTDVLAREVVQPGQPALQEIVAGFSAACLDSNGALDRGYLRRTVFTNPELRQRLEAILHPRIRQLMQARIATLTFPYCLVVVPLLTETGMTEWFHRILVVDVPEVVQIQRVMARDNVDESHARDILSAQASREQRLAIADDLLENTGDLDALNNKVERLHHTFLELTQTQY